MANSTNDHKREVQWFVCSKCSQSVVLTAAVAAASGFILLAFGEKYLIPILSQSQGWELSYSQFRNQTPWNQALFSRADCGNWNGVLRCACEDGYTWFPPSCLDPQKCHLHVAESPQSCDCHPNNLTHSVNFCERTSKHIKIPGGGPWVGTPPTPTCDRDGILALCPCVFLCLPEQS